MQDEQGGSGERFDEARLLAWLAERGVAPKLQRHPPLMTVADSQALRGDLPGAHVKNMFLKDKKGALWLITCLEERSIRIRDLEKTVGASKMSFGKPDLLLETLGVKPGAVTPLAVVNDPERRVRVVVDAQMMEAEILNCHPLHNEATVAMSAADLQRVFDATGHVAERVDFDRLEALAAERNAG